MMRAMVVLLLITLLGCARHHVVARDLGTIDGRKSISTSSEQTWQVIDEPKTEQAEDDARSSD